MYSLHTGKQPTICTTNKQYHTSYDHQLHKILGLTLYPKLSYTKHIDNTTIKARKIIQILKALTSDLESILNGTLNAKLNRLYRCQSRIVFLMI